MSPEPAYDLFVSYAPADRGWVEGYLFDALDAAGVRYVSEAAFELGAPRVAEFERAVRSSRRTLLVISPAYLADAYAPFGELLAQTFGVETGTWPVTPLTLEETSLPPRLAMLVALDATRPESWDSAVGRLCDAVGRPLPAPTAPPCPYPGMLPFREADAGRFFGRDATVAEMVERLRLHRFLAVIGPSGTGKSSLVLAGLVPALRRSTLFGPGDWHVAVFRPGANALVALDSALGSITGDGRRLVICDQFEEAFTIGRDQAAAFQERLAALTASSWVVVTVRADFYPDLMASPLWDEVRAHRVEVTPLGDAGLREAIVRPAEGVGVHVDAALVERLVADASGEPGVLPLVQETLVLSWEHLARRYLPVDAYQAIAGDETGRTGLQVAMARRADAALAELPPARQALARRVFVRLVQFGEGRADTRRQQRLAELRAADDAPGELDATVAHLVDRRLLTSTGGEDGSDRRIDLAHEALITGWPTLRGWLTERREAEQARRRLDAKAAEWVRLGRGEGGLLDEVELAETERWLAGPDASELGFDAALADLAAASRQALDRARAGRRRRVRAVIGSLAAGLLLVTGLAIWGAVSTRSAREATERAEEERNRAEEERNRAEEERREADTQRAQALALAINSRSRQLAADAVEQMDRELDRAMLLAVAAYRTEDTLQATNSLLTVLEFSPRLERIIETGVDDLADASVTFTSDGKQIAAFVDGVLRRWDAATGQELGEPVRVLTDPFAPTVAFSPDGGTLAVEECLRDTEATCRIHRWDVATGRQIGTPIATPSPYITAMAISPDGRLIATSEVGSDDAAIRLWDSDRQRWLGRPLRARAQSLAFSPDGRLLASGLAEFSTASGEAAVSLWDIGTRELLAETPVYTAGSVTALDFTSDGAVVAAGHGHGDLRVLNTGDLSPANFELDAPEGVLDVDFSPDDTTLATVSHTDDHVLLWPPDAEQTGPEELAGHRGQGFDVAFSPDSSRLVSASADGRLILWRMGDHHVLRSGGAPVHAEAVTGIGFDGDAVVSIGRAPSPDGVSLGPPEIGRWDPDEDEPAPSVPLPEGVSAISPDGRTVAVGDDRGTITRIDVTSGEAAPPIQAHRGRVAALAFGAGGQTLVSSGCREPTDDSFCDELAELAVWDAATGRPLGRGSVPTMFTRLAPSPDGSTLAVGTGGPEVWLWDVASGELDPEPLTADDSTGEMAWSPDGSLLAVTGQAGGARGPSASGRRNNNVIVWDVAARSRAGEPLLGHETGVTVAAFSPDGALLASADWNGDIRLWDVATLRPLGDRIATRSRVDVLRFSPDGTVLASGHSDGHVRLWEMRPERWIERLCAAASRDLTEEEWAEFVGDVEYEETCPGAERP